MKFPKFLPLIIAAACLVSCRDRVIPDVSGHDGEVRSVSFRLSAYESDNLDTKSEYDSGSDTFLWSDGDAVGIISTEGSQLKFPIQSEYYGQSYAKFDGRGFALLPNTTYASFSPFISDYDIDPAAVPISYEGQRQNGDNSLSGLGPFAYSAALGTASSKSALDFTFRNIGSAHRYRIPALAGEYRRLVLTIPEAEYVLSGTVNLSADNADGLTEITPSEMVSSMELNLAGTALQSNANLRCWMMMAPVNLEGEAIGLRLEMTDGKSIVASVAGRDCPANSRRVFNALTSVWPEEQSIGNDGGSIEIKLLRSAVDNEVTMSVANDWLTLQDSVTEGTVTTYTFSVGANTAAIREGAVVFTETSTGLSNQVRVIQQKAGTVIGIGGWDNDNHSGVAH